MYKKKKRVIIFDLFIVILQSKFTNIDAFIVCIKRVNTYGISRYHTSYNHKSLASFKNPMYIINYKLNESSIEISLSFFANTIIILIQYDINSTL